jgi:hypothetical protein
MIAKLSFRNRLGVRHVKEGLCYAALNHHGSGYHRALGQEENMSRTSFEDLIEGARTGDIERMKTGLTAGAPVNGARPGVYNPEISCETATPPRRCAPRAVGTLWQ